MLIMREDLKKMRQLTNEEQAADIKAMDEWTKSLAESGSFMDAAPLAAKGRYVSKTDVLSDGPFIEAKEGVAGYYIIQAASIDQAVSIAQTSPLLKKGEQVIEVRPVMG